MEIEIVRVCHFKKKTVDPETGKKRVGCERCGLAKAHPDHMGQPPSMNIFGSGNPRVYQSVKKAWSEHLTLLLEQTSLPKGLQRVVVEGEVTFPRRPSAKGPDQGNFRAPLEKILGDVLEAGGWLSNDNWASYEFGGLAHRYEAGVSATHLIIFPS